MYNKMHKDPTHQPHIDGMISIVIGRLMSA
uniref:Uncharacterized protein n=1 Tax=Rhizophora mucronata TaxID=61149 RepID=A0A2P2PZR7_RHIMU